MRRLSPIIVLTICLLLGLGINLNTFAADATSDNVMHESNGIVTDNDETIEVHTEYNAYGVGLYSTSESTSVTTTVDEDGNEVISTSVSLTESTYKNGKLSADTSNVNSSTKDSENNEISSSHYLDNYTYNEKGRLIEVKGSGESSTLDVESDHTSEGAITREFEVKDGQALLSNQVNQGDTMDKDGTIIGDHKSESNYSYVYKGGSHMVEQQVSQSDSNIDGQSSQSITRTTDYARNENGTITNMEQTAQGNRTQITADGSEKDYNLTNYNATVDQHSQVGFYVSNEDYTWDLEGLDEPGDRDAYDPWTKGELQMVDGHLALVVDPDDVQGKSFYNMDPTAVAGETKTDDEGNMIFMLGVDDNTTEKELNDLVGKEVNLMWQYYTKSTAEGSSGYSWIWLAPTSDGRVACHLQRDSEAKVEQHGGEWDRSKQYVVID